MKDPDPRGGRIINNGSNSRHMRRAKLGSYTATKHGSHRPDESTSLDGRKYDIACGQIDIGKRGDGGREKNGNGHAAGVGAVIPEARMDVGARGAAVLYMANLPLDANVQS